MKDEYDFSKGIKNPYAQKLKKEGYTVIIHYDSQQDYNEKEDYISSIDEIKAFDEYHAVNK